MYRKLSALLALIMALTVFAALPALAEEEDAAGQATVSVTTEDGITVEIGEAYFEGDRVYVSYRLSGNTSRVELHEGAPEGIDEWKYVRENCVAAEEFSADDPEAQKAIEWLDGKGQRWTEGTYAGFLDGLELADGNFADMLDGEDKYLEDGSLTGWRKCLIPKESLADTLTFKLVLSRSRTIQFQDGTTFSRNAERGEKTEIPFTLKADDRVVYQTGSLEIEGYTAKADIACGREELVCAVVLTGLDGEWVKAVDTWNSEAFTEMEMPDIITGWNLYQNDNWFNTEDAVMYTTGEDEVTYEIVVPGKDNGNDLKLVPVYETSGEHAKETIWLKKVLKK